MGARAVLPGETMKSDTGQGAAGFEGLAAFDQSATGPDHVVHDQHSLAFGLAFVDGDYPRVSNPHLPADHQWEPLEHLAIPARVQRVHVTHGTWHMTRDTPEISERSVPTTKQKRAIRFRADAGHAPGAQTRKPFVAPLVVQVRMLPHLWFK
jgi:hypothetical protein